MNEHDLYSLIVYVPQSHLSSVKEAAFREGAGRYNQYDQCCWQTTGQGQFRPLSGSQPFTGRQDVVEYVEEYRVEMLCHKKILRETIAAIKKAHPYEEPAYHAVPVTI